MKRILIVASILVIPLPVLAITTLQDTLQVLPRIATSQSTLPTGPAGYRGPRPNEAVGFPDEGPPADADAVTVSASSAPWAVVLSEGPDLKEDYVCAGTLVAPDWVLTAAHCTAQIARRWPNDVDAYVFSTTSILSSPERRFAVRQIVLNPEFNSRTLQNDIALIRIGTEGQSAGTPIGIDGPPIAQQVGEVGSILGWGITTANAERYSGKLQVIQNAVQDKSACALAVQSPSSSGTGTFCAQSLLKYHDVCSRFGGSPIVMYDTKGGLYLAGLVSSPAECRGDSRKSNAYLDVQFYRPWIKSVISGGSK